MAIFSAQVSPHTAQVKLGTDGNISSCCGKQAGVASLVSHYRSPLRATDRHKHTQLLATTATHWWSWWSLSCSCNQLQGHKAGDLGFLILLLLSPFFGPPAFSLDDWTLLSSCTTNGTWMLPSSFHLAESPWPQHPPSALYSWSDTSGGHQCILLLLSSSFTTFAFFHCCLMENYSAFCFIYFQKDIYSVTWTLCPTWKKQNWTKQLSVVPWKNSKSVSGGIPNTTIMEKAHFKQPETTKNATHSGGHHTHGSINNLRCSFNASQMQWIRLIRPPPPIVLPFCQRLAFSPSLQFQRAVAESTAWLRSVSTFISFILPSGLSHYRGVG